MRYRKIFILISLSLLTSITMRAADIRIVLYNAAEIQSIVFSTVEGEYLLSGDGKQVAVIRRGSMFHIERTGSGLAVHDTMQSYGIYSVLEFKGISGINVFSVKPVFPSLTSKESDDDLTVMVFYDAMRLINRLDLEKYIPGTVEAEGGTGASAEYYKAQAVISRTFALKNFHRHANEGFNLCDGVHCQAFNGKSRMNKQIYEATLLTKNEILVSKTGEPVITAYHANCGGITGSASVEWNRNLPYLMPVKDIFCNRSAHRNWSKTIPMAVWNDYLNKKGYIGETSKLCTQTDAGRLKYLDQEHEKILLTDMREDLKLKSSYFYVESGDGSVVIRGHGYGHGLGLCQEGAMEMARVGYTYLDILMFYYRNLKLSKI
jgi:stage II sporulation protein D